MQRFCERNKMKIRLVRNYMTKSAGTVLNTVPAARAKRMITNGIAVLVEEKKKNVADNKKSHGRTNQPNRDEAASAG